MKYGDAVTTVSGVSGVIVFGQNQQVCIKDVNGDHHWAYEDEIFPCDDNLVLETYKVKETCKCCKGIGTLVVEKERVVKR